MVQFEQKPYKNIEDYVCVPSSWIKLTRPSDQKLLVGYPVEKPWDTEKRVKRRQRLSKDWRFYRTLTVYDTDCYEGAQIFINDKTGVAFESQNKNNAG